MALIPNHIIDQVIKGTDIVQVVSEYVKLEKKGKNYFGLCPFHTEKTASFSVSPEKQIFHCFSCGEGGNVAQFIAKIDNISFIDSIKKLALKINVNIDTYFDDNRNDAISKFFDLNKFVLDYYQFALHNTSEGKDAIKYLNQRNIDSDLIDNFNIGLAPNSVDSLYLALKANDFSELLMLELGHVIKSNKQFYDKFKNRIMFPITDEYGSVVGFSGRTYLASNNSEAKYINTQETPVFKKGELLYNLHKAKKTIRQNKRVFLFEGFMDVIAAYRSGIFEAVATMGTALTVNHIGLLKKYTNNVVICFDGDSAGVEATKKAIELFASYNFKIAVVNLPNNLDPDDYVNKYGPEKYREYLNHNQKSFKEYMYELSYRGINLNNIEAIDNFKRRIFQLIISSTPTERELFLNKLSNDINVSFSTLQFDYKQYTKYIYKSDKPSDIDLINQENVFKKIAKSRPSEKKLLDTQKLLCYFSLYNRDFGNIINNDNRIAFKDSQYRRLFFDISDYYNSYLNFDHDIFYEKYLKEDSAYLTFFNNFYQDYCTYKGTYTEKHLNQCLAVIINELIADTILRLKVKLNNSSTEEDKLKYSQDIINQYQKIKVNK
jgi:DNA primase